MTTETLEPIFKRCLNLKRVDISECKNLDENVFELLSKVEGLESLGLRHFRQSFGKVGLLARC